MLFGCLCSRHVQIWKSKRLTPSFVSREGDGFGGVENVVGSSIQNVYNAVTRSFRNAQA